MPAWGWWLASCLLVAAAIALAFRSAAKAPPSDNETP